MKQKIKPVVMWAWAIKGETGNYELCYWAEPSRKMLLQGREKPSPEAKAIKLWCRAYPK